MNQWVYFYEGEKRLRTKIGKITSDCDWKLNSEHTDLKKRTCWVLKHVSRLTLYSGNLCLMQFASQRLAIVVLCLLWRWIVRNWMPHAFLI